MRTPRQLGGHSDGETPLPIPNREVKPVSADGTRGAIPRESRTPPISLKGPEKGPFVVLRPLSDDDVSAIARACDDPDTARFIPDMPAPYTEADARSFLAGARANWASGSVYIWAITDGTPDLLGTVALHVRERTAVGYWVAPWARNRGLATRAVETLSAWALGDGGFDRLELTADPENAASQRVAEKAGFEREGLVAGYVQTGSGPRDSVVFSLNRCPTP
jgi:RimJ/RimL family protein N-acetyltransferase